MEFLLNPNTAYLILVVGTFLTLVAIITPGTGIFEIGALFFLALAAYSVYRLSFNWWAALVLVLSLVPFFIAVYRPGRILWLILAMAGMVIGSVFFFPAASGFISVNPFIALVTSALYVSFLWISIRKVMQVANTKPLHDLSALIGALGEAKTRVDGDGSVQVAGELWSARSQMSIPAGSAVRVVGREGFTLLVEKEGGN